MSHGTNKWIGVRRISCTEIASRSSTPSEEEGSSSCSFGNGSKHFVIAHLLEHNPRCLGMVLATRNPLRSFPYVSLLLSSDEVKSRSSNLSSPAVGSRTSSRKCRVRPTRASTRILTPRQSSRKRKLSSSVELRQRARIDLRPHLGDSNIITADDRPFLKDIIQDENHLSTKVTGDLILDCNVVPMISSYSKNHTASIPSDAHSLLNWLSTELDNDWNKFVASHEVCSSSDESDCCSLRDEDTVGSYKASMRLAGRAHCDLGTYRTAEEAVNAYNRGVLARRTIGMKLLEANNLTRMVLARKADYMEMKRAVMKNAMSPHEASQLAAAASSRVYEEKEPEPFLTSHKVLYPKLNFHGVYSRSRDIRDLNISNSCCSEWSLASSTHREHDKEVRNMILDDILKEVLGTPIDVGCDLERDGSSTEVDGRIRLLEGKFMAVSEQITSKSAGLRNTLSGFAV